MGLFSKQKEPVFLKESSSAEKQLDELNKLKLLLNSEGCSVIEQDMKCIEYGIAGEKNIEFELKNSHMPLYILHDVYLKSGELSAQIDYLVFTPKMCFVIECKNLYGDIEINHNGDFIRTLDYNGKRKKEGIYSPITQNERHLELIKSMVLRNKKNFITRRIAEKSFNESFVPIVVLANPKTILNNRYAKKEIKDKVIKADQLVNYIKNTYEKSNLIASSLSDTEKWAESFLLKMGENGTYYTTKYNKYVKTENKDKTDSMFDRLYNELKSYRLKQSQKENIKPYYIYNDKQLKELIDRNPETLDELKQISGFGEKKAEKYGNDILNILSKYK